MLSSSSIKKANRKELRSLLLFFACLGILYKLFVSPHLNDFTLSDDQCLALNELWQEKYTADFTFSDAWAHDGFNCPSETSGMAQALYFLDGLEIIPSEGSAEIDFYQWAKELKPQLHQRPMIGFSGIAFFEKNKIDFNPDILTKNNPIEIASTLIHELRHLEERNSSHVKCVSNAALACDHRLEDPPEKGGAYSYNIYFLHQVRQFSNASTRDKRIAKRLMQTIYDTKFNVTKESDRQKYQLD